MLRAPFWTGVLWPADSPKPHICVKMYVTLQLCFEPILIYHRLRCLMGSWRSSLSMGYPSNGLHAFRLNGTRQLSVAHSCLAVNKRNLTCVGASQTERIIGTQQCGFAGHGTGGAPARGWQCKTACWRGSQKLWPIAMEPASRSLRTASTQHI